MQIRRTDKIHTEASFHDLDEYMKWTEDWFRIEEYRIHSLVKRRIYIATDDPKIFDEVAMKFVIHSLTISFFSFINFIKIVI